MIGPCRVGLQSGRRRVYTWDRGIREGGVGAREWKLVLVMVVVT